MAKKRVNTSNTNRVWIIEELTSFEVYRRSDFVFLFSYTRLVQWCVWYRLLTKKIVLQTHEKRFSLIHTKSKNKCRYSLFIHFDFSVCGWMESAYWTLISTEIQFGKRRKGLNSFLWMPRVIHPIPDGDCRYHSWYALRRNVEFMNENWHVVQCFIDQYECRWDSSDKFIKVRQTKS